MVISTNEKDYGGNYFDVVNSLLPRSSNLEIATGYIGTSTIKDFMQNFVDIAKSGGNVKLLVGMAFYEGLKRSQEDVLNELNHKLKPTGEKNGVYISINGRYHGKIYSFDINNDKQYYVGSSNFSSTGLKTNKEFNIFVQDSISKKEIQKYLDNLFDEENSKTIDNVSIGSISKRKRIIEDDYISIMNRLDKYDTGSILSSNKEFAFAFPLEYSAKWSKSHLNKYFAKGREDFSTGIVKPRPWYEVELITPKKIRDEGDYPIGDFTAYTDDGYIIPMHTSGSNYKNIESRGGLKLFGAWLKGKLEKSGSLEMFKPFDLEVLDTYGAKELKFYKIIDDKMEGENYYLEF